ncbi:Ig-like domain-containing protein [Desertivirga arenae]|uniref:Ig-like domain-containing protein n=1 Tax=Desertivirga arenae TaxID=2810309 RepID=UPI001A9762BD|nr:Ig-like domain-containing protein [Pedobacter sp. SYSU D00823]
MRKYLLFLLFVGCLGSVFAQVTPFTYNETFTNSYIKDNDIVFEGDPKKSFLTAGSGEVKDAEGEGFLRLTRSEYNQKGYIYCKTPFTSSQGFSIRFEYFTYDGGDAGADGITFFLFDANAVNNGSFQIGGFGGSLGYAPYDFNKTYTPGLVGGYIGVGMDEYGNFKINRDGRTTGLPPNGFLPPPRNSITVRGPEYSGYEFVKNVQTNEAPYNFEIHSGKRAVDSLTVGYRKCFIDMERINGDSKNGYLLTVKILVGGPTPKRYTLIDKHPYTYAPPPMLMYGIASSTGDSKNIHEIRNVQINTYDLRSNPPVANNDGPIISYSNSTKGNKVKVIDVLENDVADVGHFIPKDKVFLNSITSVQGGTLSVDRITGLVTYTPKDGYTGPDSFTYYVVDERGLKSGAATVSIIVKKRPVGLPDVAIVNIDERLTEFSVAVNDADAANVKFERKTFPNVINTHPSNFFWDDATGKFTYVPVKGSTSDSFTYVINDGTEESDEILVTIKINYPPEAKDDPSDDPKSAYYITTNTQVTFYLLDNDSDPDRDEPITDFQTRIFPGTILPSHNGDSGIQPTLGRYLYTSTKDYIGNDLFTYYLKDRGGLRSQEAKVKVKVYPKPLIGLAKSASFTEAENSSYDITYKLYIKNLNPTLSAPDFTAADQMVLSNVSLFDDLSKAVGGNSFSIKSFRKLSATGSLVLNPSFTGKKINDQDTVSTQVLNIAASRLNVGETDSIEIVVNVPFTRTTNWTISNTANTKAEFALFSKIIGNNRYTTDNSYDGKDASSYFLESPTSVTLPVPVRPTVRDTTIERYQDDPAFVEDIVAKLATITGKKTIDKATLKLTPVSGNAASASIQSDGVKFTLAGTAGATLFNYTVKDNFGVESNIGKITIVVKETPAGVADEYATLTNQEVPIMDVKANDGVNTNWAVADPQMAGITINPNGSLKYEPLDFNKDFYGDYRFTYKLINLYDGKLTPPINVTIHINNPPIGTEANLTTGVNTPLNINIAALTNDLDGTVNLASVKILSPNLSGGTVTADPANPGIWIFTPASGFSGTASFQYTIDDNDAKKKGTSAPKTITIAVGKGSASSAIGLAKQLASVVPGPNNSFEVMYVFTIKNYGAEELQNISLTDDIGLAFTNAQFIIKSLTAQGTLAVNNSFNGFSNIELLNKAQSKLAAGGTATVELSLTVKLLDKDGVFVNTAFTEANPASGTTKVRDQSTSGTKPDPAGDGDVSPRDPTLVELRFPGLFIPQGFSPNNDGTNDLFVIRNANNRKIAMQIFNRWGNRVYQSNDYQNDWNGRCTEGIYLGQDLPPGTYFYIIVLDGTEKFTGSITLNR